MTGDDNISLGTDANKGRTSNRAVGIGMNANAETEGIAIGYMAEAGNTGVAVGRQSIAQGTGTAIGPKRHMPIGLCWRPSGLNSYAAQSDVSGTGRFTNRAFNGSAVSVGSSQPGSEHDTSNRQRGGQGPMTPML